MNPGAFQGAGQGVAVGTISRYIQTPTISSSQTIAVPPGTQRIEALLCGGGGGGGGSGGGGGFGGAAIIEIPITGSPLQVVIGAGGAAGNDGSPTYVVSANTRYAEVGGGGKGAGNNVAAGNGRSGGGGGGSGVSGSRAGTGGCPPIGNLLWSIYPTDGNNTRLDTTASGGAYSFYTTAGCGMRSDGRNQGLDGSFGGGGGGGALTLTGGAGGGGGSGNNAQFSVNGSDGVFGGGGGNNNGTSAYSGGSLTSAVPVWGYSGFAGGSPAGDFGGGSAGGGGGGLLSAGSNATATQGSNTGGAGGNGGGGGGGGGTAGAGGNGFAAIRFYL